MATDWETTYRHFTDTELAEEIEDLQKKRKQYNSAQNVGNHGFTRDIRLINDQFKAAIKVRGERRQNSGPGTGKHGVVDYSGLDIS
jgi:hypothetical protein